MAQPARPELDRAWEGYFAQRGGQGTTAPSTVLPVVIFDDTRGGPYPPCRVFRGGAIFSPIAGIVAEVGIQNCDLGFSVGVGLVGTTGVPGSVVVVDYVMTQRDATVGGDLFATITHNNLQPLTVATDAPVEDLAPQKDPTSGSTRPQIGNVRVAQKQNLAAIIGGDGNRLIGATADALGHRYDGPWVLGPGQILYIERNLVNVGIFVTFHGRYYPAP